jgi:uncharacterized membrane protein YccF (DUF307 family)
MRILGNLLWLLFGGFVTAMEYFTASIALFVTIIGIPFAIQTFKIGLLQLWPFGAKIKEPIGGAGTLSLIMNIIWFFVGGLWIWLTHIFFGILLAITIIGWPFAQQHFKLAALALKPFGREISLDI